VWLREQTIDEITLTGTKRLVFFLVFRGSFALFDDTNTRERLYLKCPQALLSEASGESSIASLTSP